MARLCEFSRIRGYGAEHNARRAVPLRSKRKRPVTGSREWPDAPTSTGQAPVVLWWHFRQHLRKSNHNLRHQPCQCNTHARELWSGTAQRSCAIAHILESPGGYGEKVSVVTTLNNSWTLLNISAAEYALEYLFILIYSLGCCILWFNSPEIIIAPLTQRPENLFCIQLKHLDVTSLPTKRCVYETSICLRFTSCNIWIINCLKKWPLVCYLIHS